MKYRINKEQFFKMIVPPIKLIEKPECQQAIKEHLMSNAGLSDNALVALIVNSVNQSPIAENYLKELTYFEYYNDGSITDKGKEYINSPDTIDKLNEMLNEGNNND
jgi:rhodanese-related sulfurtransferase